MCAKSRTAALLLLTASVAGAEQPQFGASLAELHDGNNDNSVDFDATFAPAALKWLDLGGGVGSTKLKTPDADLDGTTLRAFAGIHVGQLELRGYYRNWNTDGYDTDTVGGRASYHIGGFTLTAIGEHRVFDVDYNAGTADTPQQATARFSGNGWGGGMSFNQSGWSAYAEGIFYHYRSLSQYVAPTTVVPVDSGGSPTTAPTLPLGSPLPTLPGVPGAIASRLPSLASTFATVVPAFTGSYVTVTQGALDHLLTAGIERDFSRTVVRLDWSGARDAVFNTNSNSFSVSGRYTLTRALSAGLTVGTTHAYFGSTNFGGVSVGMNF